MHKLAGQFIWHYKMQSLAILLGMICSIALLTGIRSLVYSGVCSDLMNAKNIYGDWNYCIPEQEDTLELITWDYTPGYRVEEYGILKTVCQKNENRQQEEGCREENKQSKEAEQGNEERDQRENKQNEEAEQENKERDQQENKQNEEAEQENKERDQQENKQNEEAEQGNEERDQQENKQNEEAEQGNEAERAQKDGIVMQYADEVYLDMMGQPVIEGHYPESEHEIAMSLSSIKSLDSDAGVGDEVEAGGRIYRLSGIVKDPWALDQNKINVYISKNAAGVDVQSYIYLKLDESMKMYKQREAVIKDLKISESDIAENRSVNAYLGADDPHDALSKIAESVKQGRLRFLDLVHLLKGSSTLAVNGIIWGLRLFVVFVIYSIFQINIAKRIAEHGILQALGIGRINQFLLVLDELMLLLLGSFPIGAVLGNISAGLLYQKFYMVFLDQGVVPDRGYGSRGMTEHFIEVTKLSAQSFGVSASALIFDFLFLAAAMVLTACCLVRRTEKMTAVQMMNLPGQGADTPERIYSRTKRYMPGVVNSRFMFAKKSSFISILISLSLGGTFFLCTNYVMVNTKAHNQMLLAADDGLGSDYKLYKDNMDLNDVISRDLAGQLEKVDGVRQVYSVQSYVGELLFEKDELLWKDIFESHNEEYPPEWNNIANKRAGGGYAVKCNILGYDDAMIGLLEPHKLEGTCSAAHIRKKNEIILVTLRDGMGNYDGITKHAGDTICIKVPKKLSGSREDLRLAGDENQFEIKEFKIAAVIKQSLLKDSRMYTDKAVPDLTFSVIMTQEQMQQSFSVRGMRVLGIEADEHADTIKTADCVSDIVSGEKDVVFQDYTDAIKKQNEYIEQKTYFLSGVAVMFFVISLFHMINAMSHIVLAKKHEYGILRAMGITDRNFIRMMAEQGLWYGCCASLVMLILYAAAARIAAYFMADVYMYLVTDLPVSPVIFLMMAAANITVGVIAVMIPAYTILKEDIIYQMNL